MVVTSAGNCGSEDYDTKKCNTRHERKRPAIYPEVIAVTATGDDRIRAPHSTSNQDVDIAAPGGRGEAPGIGHSVLREVILSTWPTTVPCGVLYPGQPVGTCWDSGTSMAAPVVSGVVAHLKAHHPEASVADIKSALYSTADRTNDSDSKNYDHDYGHGFINPLGAFWAIREERPALLAAGTHHYCALDTNGNIECWPYNAGGLTGDPQNDPTRVSGNGPFTSVAVGRAHTCAILHINGAITCWGNNDHDQATPKGGPFVALTAGRDFTCGLHADLTIECWGKPDYSIISDKPDKGPYTAITAGSYHACALDIDGNIECWGNNWEYGGADEDDAHLKEAVADDGPYLDVAAGYTHTCALRENRTATCWGRNPDGRATPPPGRRSSPRYDAITAGKQHTCALQQASGTVHCWGNNDQGQAPEVKRGPFDAIDAGDTHTCGLLKTGDTECWGTYRKADIADEDLTNVPGTYSAVEVGDNYSCGLRTDGTVVCWGLNNANQASPPADTWFTAISAGQLFTCGLREDRTIQCWGQGNSPPDGSFRALTVDDNHGCAIKTDGLAECWVIRNMGSTAKAEAPADVRFADIAASAIHSCGLTDGKPGLRSVECWGDDQAARGFSGGGQVSDRPLDSGFLEVAADSEYACAIRTNRTIICWGGDDIRGRPTGRTTPPPSDKFLDVAPGHQHACGIRLDGSIACWGQDTDKVLSDAPTSGKFKDISSGDFHSCALRDNGTIECWGRNHYGQTDVPSELPRV